MIKRYLPFSLYSIIISLIYIAATIYINNFDLLNNTVFGNYPMEYKFKIFNTVFSEISYTLPAFQFIILWLTALLTAANLILLFQKIKLLKSNHTIKVIIGSSTLLGLTATGCAACGIPLLAFLGITSSLSFLPLKGTEFSLLTITLLLLSLTIIYKNTKTALNCDIPQKKPIKKRKQ